MNQRIIPVGLDQSIMAVLASLPDDGKPVTIQLEEGTYTEKIVVERGSVTIRGKGMRKTRLSFSDAALTNGMGTFASSSVTIKAPFFEAESLTFANDFDYPSRSHMVSQNPGKVKGLQAVALRTMDAADHSVFNDCAFFGYQDTLLLDRGVHLLNNCEIEGNIDFIFGSGKALFEECRIISNGLGYVMAPSTKIGDLGFCFHRCTFDARGGIEDGSIWLGRPWHPGGDPQVSSYAFLYECMLGPHIQKDGWTWMHAFPPSGEELFYYPKDSRFLEASCTGIGACVQREQGFGGKMAESEYGKFL